MIVISIPDFPARTPALIDQSLARERIYCEDDPLFHISAGVPVDIALSKASDLLSLSKAFAQDAAFPGPADRHAWAAYYLAAMGKAIIDDVVKAVSPRPHTAKMKTAT